MMAITHAAIAAAGTSLLFGTSDLTYLALAVVGSQLPDLDSTESVLGQICFPLSNWIENRYPHRSVTHSFVASAALALSSMAVGYLVGGNLWAFVALPVGHLLACFADTFTRQGVQLFWPEPVWCISVSNPRRRLITGGPGEYWVLAVAVGLLVLGCWMANKGGVTGQVNQTLGLRGGAIATYNANATRDVYAEIVGVWAGDRSRADGRYLILATDDKEFIVTDGSEVYHTSKSMTVEKLSTTVGEPTSRQTQTLTFGDEEPSAQLQQLAIAHAGRKAYLSGTLTVDYPEGIRLGIPGRGIQTATLSGESLTLNYHPLDLALPQLVDQWVTGQLVVLIQ
ncbi:MAG: metal-dependent hydrolase [Elainellaceae cyanobacterium]